jgi:hypothetical protein
LSSSGQNLDDILKRLDNEKFFLDQGLKIKKRRGKSWPCECPFCGDQDHFAFDPQKGMGHCFKCMGEGEGVNAVSFYARKNNCSNGEAVKVIKQYIGIPEDEGKPPRAARKPGNGKSSANNKKGDATHKTGTSNNKKGSSTTPPPPSSPPTDVPSSPAKMHIYERLVQMTHLTPEHREELHKKRGFSDEIVDLLRFRSGGDYIVDIVEQKLKLEYTDDELTASGILVETNGTRIINDQLLADKKTGAARVLIPYLDEAGLTYHLRPHKLGFKGIPVEPYCRLLLKNWPEHVILAESEFKAAALLQWGIPAIGIPGIPAFGDKNLERFVEFLKATSVQKITIIFDSETKDNPDYPNFKERIEDRYDTQYWSYMMGYLLGKAGFKTRVGWLPAEWRENGKIDFDGALAQGRTRAEIEAVIAAAKTPNEFKDSLEEEAHRIVERKVARNFAKKNLRRDFNKYVAIRYTAQQKSYEEVISNFVINIKSSFFTAGGVIRNVEMVNQYGETSDPFPLEPGAMAGVNEFKKFLLSKGNYLFHGNAKDLNVIWEFEFLRDSGDLIWMPEQIGRITRDIWLFGNLAIKDGKVYRPDEDGVIWIDGKGYKPQSLEIGPGGNPVEDAIPALVQRQIDIKDIAEKMRHCIGGYEAYMMLGWVIAVMFSREIFEQYKCMPILFPHGKRESGKSTAMRWLMNFFGVETEGISVGKTTTQNYIARVLAYYSSLGVWFDEYRNEPGVVEKDGFFRSAYNRQLSGKGTATAFHAKGFAVHAALSVSGEELPRDNGLFTRCIPLQISAYKRQRDWFDWLNINCAQFSGFTYELLISYGTYLPKVLESIAGIKAALVKRGVTDRTAENWAICAGAFWAAVEQDKQFIKWVEAACQEIKKTGEEDHMLNQFWEDVNFLVSTGDITPEFFKVDDKSLFVPFSNVFQRWSIHYKKKTNREPFDETSIRKYLSDEPYFRGVKKEKFYQKGGYIERRGIWVDLTLATDSILEIADGIRIRIL